MLKQIFTFLLLLVILSCSSNPSALSGTNQQFLELGDQNNLEDLEVVGESLKLNFLKPLTVDTSLSLGTYIKSLYQDQKGNMWMGTFFNAIYKFNGKSLLNLQNKEGVVGNNIRDIVEDGAGNIWFASNDGLLQYDGSKFTNFTVKEGLVCAEVTCLVIDKSGVMWIGTEDGLCFFNGKSFTPFVLPPADISGFDYIHQAPRKINSLFQDDQENIWVAQNGGGVYRINNKMLSKSEGVYTHFTESNGLCNNFITGISGDKAGNIWLSSRFNGVNKFDGKSFTHFSKKDGLSSDFVWKVFEDTAGRLWFPTAGGGVCKFDGTSFKTFTKKDGLADDFVQTIMQDKDGLLWFGTASGLSSYDGKTFKSNNKSQGGC
jgi:ligand-binding sensor domain-containing protein